MDVRILDTADQIAVAAGELFVRQIKTNPQTILGLATGASPVKMYQYLISQYRNGYLDFSKVKTYNLDEYCDLPRDDKNSYYTFMHENLFNHINIKEENVHLPNGNAPDMAAECASYDKMIADIGGVDIQLLGIGTNGHIGFNEPADTFTEGTYKVKLTDSTIKSNSIYFDEGAMPRFAVTMGVGTIMTAKKIVLIATGESKQNAVCAMVRGEVTPRCPASILQQHPDAVIFADRAAAAKLL